MQEIEIISGTDLIKRLDIPPYSLFDDLRYRGKFCPRDKKTGTPIPPPGHESELKAILKLEKIVSEKEIALEMAVSEKKSALERVQETALESIDSGVPPQSTKDLQRPYEARERGIEADLDLYRRQLALLTHLAGYPLRMWERYCPADEEEKGRAIGVLLEAVFWVRFEVGANRVLEATVESPDSNHSQQPVHVVEDVEASSENNSPKKLVRPAANADKMRQRKYLTERILFEGFLKDDIDDHPESTMAAMIRRAKKKVPDLEPVPDGLMRKWYKKIAEER
ncbi:MAG: hypothetical protein WAN11_12490 [Syntrophobacteraceae bacterium]